jgi:selenocysteine lyase/cysteine desulfurase
MHSAAAITRWAQEASLQGDVAWPGWARRVETLRGQFVSLLGASPDEIALVHNTSEGVGFVAEGFPWTPGDNVVTLADEFPSNQYPWLNLATRNVETRRVPTDDGKVDYARVAAACDARTRIVSVSWVSFSSGWRNDLDALAELAHRRGALLFVDVIQGLGVNPLDVRQTAVDFAAADGHKWLLGAEGAGVLYVRRQHLDRLRPLGVGWNSVEQPYEFSRIEPRWKHAASRYEGGSQNMIGAAALSASLELLAQFGPAAMGERIFQLTDEACQRLQQIGACVCSDRTDAHKSGIVVFDLPNRDPAALRQRCLDAGVVLSCRGGRLRISPHAYNNAEDLDRLIEALRPY